MHTSLLPTLGLMIALAGCSTPPPAPAPAAPPALPATSPKPKTQLPAWVRLDRYTLVTTRPTLEQRQPLYQLVNVQIAPALNATVGEALRHVLHRSGYALCADSPAVDRLFRRPLPVVQHQLGPISLLDALTIIGGPAWRLEINPVERSVCYALRVPSPAPPISTLEIAP
ncbi:MULTISPECIES: PilL N-terminal domain-containing protein [unclassified Pseudomonas]|uniref:PFGI-1 class ICE element type IV pilus protein PilL2 n=1 Tax=unclassified Pseudomonas TaxID=196821 RepID=UPI00224875EC|nr:MULTISPECIES: PilL N-terminal domain-containing protein [unclassified Pseudomonas]MCX2706995.1 PilL N-terminal domain-containing protein [Pseudomonas sp. DCB_BG]MCX2815962.1 PilL N-terminal domain-containing protein [Pseudomonas sp. DCB_E]MCX2889305.1 PilL N-terminal domain-containing protein [Pseudomonas sp. DCB_BI]MCX9142694.1 PilL N-terminal domain-containing protein [Pseudomonas sp. DCB_Q]